MGSAGSSRLRWVGSREVLLLVIGVETYALRPSVRWARPALVAVARCPLAGAGRLIMAFGKIPELVVRSVCVMRRKGSVAVGSVGLGPSSARSGRVRNHWR